VKGWTTIAGRVGAMVVATGVASVVTQLLLVREFLSQFQGNEIVLALVLFGWLLLGGIGTRLAHRVKIPHPAKLAGWSLILAGLAACQIPVIRWLRMSFYPVGLSLGFYPTLFFILSAMAPYAALVGFVLPLSLAVMRTGPTGYPGYKIYLLDNAGDICGGALFAFALVYWTTPLQAVLLVHLPLVLLAVGLAPGRRTGAFAFIVTGLLFAGLFLENTTLSHPAGRLIHYEESRFGRLCVYQDQGQTSLLADGRPTVISQNFLPAEEAVHYPLAQLANPQKVLVISAEFGMMAELAKYNLEHVDYLELDPAMARILKRFGLMQPLDGLHTFYGDARLWLRDNPQQYDAVLLNVPEADTFQLNRLFTDRFFTLVKSRLAPGGVFSFTTTGYANYLSELQRKKLSTLWVTARRIFSHVRLLPAERVVFLCSDASLTDDIPARLTDKGIRTRFVAAYFNGNLTPERIAEANTGLDAAVPVNQDQKPYLMQLVYRQWFAKFGSSPWGFAVICAVTLLIYVMRMHCQEFVLFTTGFVAMGSEIILVFAFQIFLGYIYFKIGLIVTVFLAGLLPGAWLAGRQFKPLIKFFWASDGLLIACMLIFLGLMHWVGDRLPEGIYYIVGFCLSMICGFQFPVILSRLGDSNSSIERLFAVDLAGAALGVLMTSTLFIPYLGLQGAVLVLAAIKGASFLLSITFHSTEPSF
jgi:spermidine synthase